jgi:exosortase/archaeosortase family protein
MSRPFSFIILTYNEELHLPRLLESIAELNAPIFILDSGSTDKTIEIGEQYGAVFLEYTFENHPKQWDFALRNFPVTTPWVICLDADQIVTPELRTRLQNFKDEDHAGIDGIYFNRKNFFKGKWIKHGGYYPFYLLKMFRYGTGYSDINENMDHRFIVPGKTEVWKDGIILEENLKENNIRFWIDKHNRYSDLVAQEEVERMEKARTQTLQPNFWGSPDERTAWRKQLWWKLPRYVRPMLYFMQRIIFQFGFLDGRTGIIFHFLQGFWFRLIVDIKIDEILSKDAPLEKNKTITGRIFEKASPIRFLLTFWSLFAIFYYFNVFIFGITSRGNHYNQFIAEHFNYISALQHMLLGTTAQLLNWMGFTAITNDSDLLVVGRGTIQIAYDCLGLAVMSFFAALVIAFPKNLKQKLLFLICGLVVFQSLNIVRFVLLALFWKSTKGVILDHHTIFNLIIYILIAISLYLWIRHNDRKPAADAKNN